MFAASQYKGEPCWGMTYHEDKKIAIDPRVFNPAVVKRDEPQGRHVTPRSIVIHESLHGAMPWASEAFVDALSIELDNILDELDL